MAGIVGYGAYVPRRRIDTAEIARQWGKDPEIIRRGLQLERKSVPGPDEDTITISVAAARAALDRASIEPSRIGAVYIGSESHPYAVKPSGTVLIDALGIRRLRLVIGGSLGGMQALEWTIVFSDLVESAIVIAAGGRHSAWCIGLAEAQRSAIRADDEYRGGYYPADRPPEKGLFCCDQLP